MNDTKAQIFVEDLFRVKTIQAAFCCHHSRAFAPENLQQQRENNCKLPDLYASTPLILFISLLITVTK